MSIKGASQNLSGNNTVSRALGVARGLDAIYDGEFDPFYNKVTVQVSDSDYSDDLMTDRSGNNWQEFYGCTTYARGDMRQPILNGPRYKHWCTRFDGDGGYYNYTDTPHLRFGYQDFTIEFWIKPLRNSATQHYIMAKGGGAGTASGTGWVIGLTSTYQIIFGVGQATATTYIGTTTMLRDTWYHVVVQRSSLAANGLKIYVNGVAEVTTGQANVFYNETGTFKVGRDRDLTAGTQYGGNITDIRIQTGVLLSRASATAVTTNLITVDSTAGFVVNQRVVFSGSTLTSSNIVIGTVYYIRTVDSATTFTISATTGPGAVFALGASSAGGPMVANVLTYTAATPTLPTAALDMSGQYVVYSMSMLYPTHPDEIGTLTMTDVVTKRIDSPFIVWPSLLTGHGAHSIGSQDTNSGIRIYDSQSNNGSSLRLGNVFTVEAWVYPIYGTNWQRAFFGKGTTGWTFEMNNSGFIEWYDNVTTLTATDTRGRLYRAAWYHVAAVREGTGTNQFKMYLNGTLLYTGTLSTSYAADTTFACLFDDRTNSARIGAMNGYLSGIKWTNGEAKYAPAAQTALVTDTAVSGLLTISTASTNTSILKLGMPITFTGTQVGGLIIGTTYYVYSIPTTSTFMIATTRGATAPAVLTVSSGGTTMYTTVTPKFDVTTTGFLDTMYTTSTSTVLLVGTVGTGTVAMNTNAHIDLGQTRSGVARRSNEFRFEGGGTPFSRHGGSAWYPTGAKHRMNAFVNSSNPNDFTFNLNDFSIELWLNQYDNYVSSNQSRLILDSRSSWNDTGIRIRATGLFGIDVLTSGKIILSSARNIDLEAQTTISSNKLSTGPATPAGGRAMWTWYHMCVQRVSGKIALYINGRRVDENYYPYAINPTAPPKIYIGNSLYQTAPYSSNYDVGWYGFMSDLRICNGNGAYGIGLTSNPDTIPVPTVPLKTTTNCVLLTYCQSYITDYSGRGNRVGYEQTVTDANSTWEVKYSAFSPYSGVEYDVTTAIPVSSNMDNNGGYVTNGAHVLRDQTNTFTEYSFINRMSTAWTIEFFFMIHQSGTNVRATPTAHQHFYTANSAGQHGFQIDTNYINGATASFGDICLTHRTAAVTEYLQTSSGLAAKNGEGWYKPYMWNHVAFVYDPSQATPMALFINGARAATRAAFTAGLVNWNTYALNQSHPATMLRISNVARYSAAALTYTVPTQKFVTDANTITLIDNIFPVKDKKQTAPGNIYGIITDTKIKKFGNASLRLGQGPETLTANAICRFDVSNGGWMSTDVMGLRVCDMTIEMWASWRSLANGGLGFSQAGQGNFLWSWADNICVGVNSTGYWKFQHVPSHTDAQHWIYNVGPGSNSQIPNTTASYGYQLFQSNQLVAQASLANPNAFDHIVVMRRNNNFYWYINGVEMCQMSFGNHLSYGAAANTTYAPVVAADSWDPTNSTLYFGNYSNYLVANYWNGWVQDVRVSAMARYDTVVINNVPTMVYRNTNLPALPTKILPTK